MYDHGTGKELCSIKAFETSSIHGLTSNDPLCSASLILAWGGRSLCVLQVDTQAGVQLSKLGDTTIFDWILDASFKSGTVSDDSENSASKGAIVGIVTAHNSIVQIQVVDGGPVLNTDVILQNSSHSNHDQHLNTSSTIYVNQLTTGSRTICYSAHLRWLFRNIILSAAGTAFGEVILSTYDLNGDIVLRSLTFSGHEGSIFGVRILEPTRRVAGQSALQLLSTCSDDRTIRVWDITGMISDVDSSPHHFDATEAKKTGFQSYSAIDDARRRDDRRRCLASAMGHVSRIWSVQFIEDRFVESNHAVRVTLASVGEDATCWTWELLPEVSNSVRCPSYILRQIGTAITHSGKNIWSISATEPSKLPLTRPLIVTGGADSGVNLHSLEDAGDNSGTKSLQWCISTEPEDINTTSSSRTLTTFNSSGLSEDLVRAYAFLKDGRYLFSTNSGKVFVSMSHPMAKQNQTSKAFILAGTFRDLAGYSVAVGLPSQNIAFISGARGMALCYDGSTGRIFEVWTACSIHEYKVARLFTQEVDVDGAPNSLVVLAIAFVQSTPPHIVLLGRQESGEWTVLENSHLPLLSSVMAREVTSFLTISDEDGRLVQFVGFRSGCVVVLMLELHNLLGEPVQLRSMRPVQYATLYHAHGKDAVTAMRWVPKKSRKGGWLYSVGRDGNIITYDFDKAFSDETELHHIPMLVHQLPVPLGRDLEGLYINERLGELLVYGFHRTKFVLYDAINAQEIISIQCGGAHRNWAFDIHFAPGSGRTVGGSLLWTKTSKSNLCSVMERSTRTLRPGLHGREIKTCAIAPKVLDGSSLGPLLATGAEDTDIRLTSYDSSDKDGAWDAAFRCVAIIRKHDTGIQSLKWSESANHLFSSGGFEEFHIWRVHVVPILGVGVVCESSLPVPREGSEQRISDFVVKEMQNGDEELLQFHITMIYSNSFIKTYQYSQKHAGRNWSLLFQAQYTTSCLTIIESVPRHNSPCMVTGATDGRLAIWREDTDGDRYHEPRKQETVQDLALTRCVGLHQNSIKTVSLVQLSPTATIALTGGDDNAIGITIIRYGASETEHAINSILIPRAHAASVTSSALFLRPISAGSNQNVERRRETFELRAVTSGNDQRVKTWAIGVDLSAPGVEGVDVRRVGSTPTAVADVSSIAVFPKMGQEREGDENKERRLLICGVGLEVWTFGL